MATATIQQFPATLEDRLAELVEARAQLMAEIESGVSEAGASLSNSDRWSIAEVAYHLHLSEMGISKLLHKALKSGDRHERVSDERLRAEWEHIRARVGTRQPRATAPASAVPTDAPDLADAVDRLHQSRQRLFEMLSQVSLDELASISMPHPLEGIGTLTGAGWVTLIAYHERRHIEQIREIKAGLG